MASIDSAIGKRWTAVAIAIAVTLFVILTMVFIRPTLLERLEGENYDVRFREIRKVDKPGPETVIVAADEKTAAAFGRWPFSHRYFATAIDRLKRTAPRSSPST